MNIGLVGLMRYRIPRHVRVNSFVFASSADLRVGKNYQPYTVVVSGQDRCTCYVFSPTASRKSTCNTASSTVMPSWKSVARTVLLSSRVLKTIIGSCS